MAGRKTIEYYSGGGFGDKITPRENDTTSAVFRAHKGQLFLEGVAKTFVDGIDNIRSQYKDDLHSAKIAELAGKCLKEIPKGIAQFLKPVEQNYISARGKVNDLTRQSSSDAVSAVRRMELRTHLKSLDHKERVEIFQQAVQNGDDEVVGAFVENNRLYKLLDEKILADGQRQWLSKKAPELETEYFDTERAGSILARNFTNTVRDLMFYASMPPGEIGAIADSIPKPGWNHELSPDAAMIESGAMPSRLPAPTMTKAK